jgi:hypothetical protein
VIEYSQDKSCYPANDAILWQDIIYDGLVDLQKFSQDKIVGGAATRGITEYPCAILANHQQPSIRLPLTTVVRPIFGVVVAQNGLARSRKQQLRWPWNGTPTDEPDRRDISLAFE